MHRFLDIFPDIARAECLALRPGDDFPGPRGTYLFIEFYCIEPGCDCRRVIIQVQNAGTGQPMAGINHLFERPSRTHPDADLGQTFLDPLNPQSRWAAHFMNLFLDVLREPGPAYLSRLIRHYEMVKEAVEDPRHPLHEKLAALNRSDGSQADPAKVIRTGRNAPCPCGSGRKYKRCCGNEAPPRH